MEYSGLRRSEFGDLFDALDALPALAGWESMSVDAVVEALRKANRPDLVRQVQAAVAETTHRSGKVVTNPRRLAAARM